MRVFLFNRFKRSFHPFFRSNKYYELFFIKTKDDNNSSLLNVKNNEEIVKKIIGTLLLSSACVFADEAPIVETIQKAFSPLIEGKLVDTQKTYFQIGLGTPGSLQLGFGTRFKKDYFGLDLSIGYMINTAIDIKEVIAAKASWLYYFKPNAGSQNYAGIGLGLVSVDPFLVKRDRFDILLMPNVVFGKEFINKKGKTRFFEVQGYLPMDYEYINIANKRATFRALLPSLSFNYGLIF